MNIMLQLMLNPIAGQHHFNAVAIGFWIFIVAMIIVAVIENKKAR